MDRPVVTVFGGSGFIGRHLVPRLVVRGWTVRVAVRNPDAALFLKTIGQAGEVVPLFADVTDKRTVETVTRGASAVVNLVGILYERGKRTFQRVHVEGAAIVAEAAQAAGAAHLVQLSAIGADLQSASAYARSKAQGENKARDLHHNAFIVRPSVVFGPEDDFLNRFARLARVSPVLPVFDTRLQPVYVGDVAEGITRIVSQGGAGRTYELGGPLVLSFREIVEMVMAETGRRRLLIRMPAGLAAVQAMILERLPVPPLTRDQLKLLERDNVVAADAATLADLGIEPTAVEAIIPSYLRRYRRHAQVDRPAG